MPATRALAALSAALVLAGAAPAYAADPVPTLLDRVDAAIANATSYRVHVEATDGLSIEIVSFGPDRIHVTSALGPFKTESVVVGPAMYVRNSAAGWTSATVPVVKMVRKNRLYMAAPDAPLLALDDRTDAGTVVGAFRTPAVAKGVTGTMDCTYDKATYRPRTCVATLPGLTTPVLVSYDRWDDPANAVEPPPGAPSPAPAPLPGASKPPAAPGAPN